MLSCAAAGLRTPESWPTFATWRRVRRIALATLRIVRARGRAALEVSGAVSPAQLQQLRNVVGSVSLAKLVNVQGRR